MQRIPIISLYLYKLLLFNKYLTNIILLFNKISYFSFQVYKDGVYRILGRTSVDIIKSGGYKIR